MVRIPRRTHSMSGPPTHSLFRDVACCCNLYQIQQFNMLVMGLRRNPYRKCKIEEVLEVPVVPTENKKRRSSCTVDMQPPANIQRTGHKSTRALSSYSPARNGPFAFFDLPREVRDHVFSYLVVRHGRQTPILEAKTIIRDQKKRAILVRNRENKNMKRFLGGKPPVALRDGPKKPIVHLTAMRASKSLYREAKDCFYQRNYFAISLDSFPATTFEIPTGWDCSRMKKMQLELQLKDAQRMNSYIDWASFFARFPSLVHLRIIPSFHPRYHEWARTELEEWSTAHFVFRSFFRELLASMPEHLVLKLGLSSNPAEDMQLEGRAAVSKSVLWDMYTELGPRMGLRRPASMMIDNKGRSMSCEG
ncbi:hypothetical protein BU23DRAFT_228619 [Bimuria novae-zelandiae CBS 107.79]|uniref:F-box domain-containing protein n=1 Tax=Bimuria novae-zelandiae CBS 107.79 TaxID=1447943 RepID=A0A6A5VLI4_9PLEO|nr:hypothetical protein BU23DRAFT_228619 [Bimuria novae-zelandiae CBS 107.79]